MTQAPARSLLEGIAAGLLAAPARERPTDSELAAAAVLLGREVPSDPAARRGLVEALLLLTLTVDLPGPARAQPEWASLEPLLRSPALARAGSTLRAAMDDVRHVASPTDLVGRLFEATLPAAGRHHAGQHFTPDALADLASAYALGPDAREILDPSCGSGAFLLRALARARRRPGALPRLWGVDTDWALARLATFNLAEAGATGSPPPLRADFFELDLPTEEAPEGAPRLPLMDAVVGNPPYTRQEHMARLAPGLKERAHRRSASLVDGPLSRRTSLYALFLLRAGAWVRPGGRLALVLFDSWLDVEYAAPIRAQLVRDFRIDAIVSSRVERWFAGADVPTCLLLAERREARHESAAPVRLVALDQPLCDLLGDAGSPSALLDQLLTPNASQGRRGAWLEVEQPALETAERGAAGVSWGRALRAPAAFHELLGYAGGRLAPLSERVGSLRRGLTTGANSFFYLEVLRERPAPSPELLPVRTAAGEELLLEQAHLLPVLKSMREVTGYRVRAAELSRVVLQAPGRAEDLVGTAVEAYLRRGECEPFPSKGGRGAVPASTRTCRARRPWYQLPRLEPPHLVLPKRIGRRFLVPLVEGALVEDQTLYGVVLPERREAPAWAALLSSTVARLLFEVFSYDLTGALTVSELNLTTAARLPVPAPPPAGSAARSELLAAFDGLAVLPALGLDEELLRPQRRRLDLCVLALLGVPAPRRTSLLDELGGWLSATLERRERRGRSRAALEATQAWGSGRRARRPPGGARAP